jgi:hypothetical protein
MTTMPLYWVPLDLVRITQIHLLALWRTLHSTEIELSEDYSISNYLITH